MKTNLPDTLTEQKKELAALTDHLQKKIRGNFFDKNTFVILSGAKYLFGKNRKILSRAQERDFHFPRKICDSNAFILSSPKKVVTFFTKLRNYL